VNILGISAFYHDSAAALVCDGKIVAAAQEERFSRIKHDPNFPNLACDYVLKEAGLKIEDVDLVAFYDKPFTKFERILKSYLNFAPRGLPSFLMAMPLWLKQKLLIPKIIERELEYDGDQIFPEHHQSHAASAFFPSPYQSAAFLTLDGVGEWTTASFGVGKDNKVDILGEIKYPHSIGLLYSAFTYYLGFRVNSGEYKVMGLAPYGEPKYVDLIRDNLINIKDDGSFALNTDYFTYLVGLRMTGRKFAKLFGAPARKPETPLSQREMDLAASVQKVTEEVMLKAAAHVRKVTGEKYLCLAGGVALNCVGNGHILRSGLFDDIWIQPAAGDAGGAVGAALFGWYQYQGNERKAVEVRDAQKCTYLGPEYKDEEIEAFLTDMGVPFKKLDKEQLPKEAARLIADEKVIGWFQGKLEFGPRALGSRSIVGDARSPHMQRTINLKIKYRESFRPFAPTVMEEDISEFFDIDRPSPYMLLVAQVRKDRLIPLTQEQEKLSGLEKLHVPRSTIPAITHVDNSARIQSVSADCNPPYHAMIKAFKELTGTPVIINTSFNVRGEPIVCTPHDAYTCFMRTEMDYLFLGSFMLDKTEMPPLEDDFDWRKHFAPD
jgi:carbamoyltransferase